MKKVLFFLIVCLSHNLHGWVFSDVVTTTTNTVSNWFTKQEAQTTSKEYPIKTTSPITISNETGSIKVTTWNKPALLVEATKRGSEEDIQHTIFTVTINQDEEQSVSIKSESRSKDKKPATIDYAIMLPRTAPLAITTNRGSITIIDHAAPLNLQTAEGSISIEQASGNVIAKTLYGSITVQQNELKDDASMLLEAERDITVVIPENANSTLNAHTAQGRVFSEIYVTLDPITVKLDKETYKQMQRHVRGTTGTGGTPITLESIKGNIMIMGS